MKLNLQSRFLACSKLPDRLSLKYLIPHHLLYHQTSSCKVHSFSYQEKRSHRPHSTPLEVSTTRTSSTVFMWCCHFVCLASVPWLTGKPVLYQTIQGPSPHTLEEQLSHQLWTKSCGDSHSPDCLGVDTQLLASENKQQRTPVSPSSQGGCFDCPYEQVLIKLISWVQSAQTALSPGK